METVTEEKPKAAETKTISCRVCKYPTEKFFDFGPMPLSNNLERSKADAENAERFPLVLHRCPNCSLVQLSEVVDPERLYKYYTYRSGMSMTFKRHCMSFAEKVKERVSGYAAERGLLIDIAGNDGTLARIVADAIDCMPLVVDPAHNILPHAQANGCAIKGAFWGVETAKAIMDAEKQAGRFIHGAQVITATNVFAHVNDLDDFTKGVGIALANDGMFVCEFPHGLDFIDRCEFDTAYFEHLSYMTLTAFRHVMTRHMLEVFDVEKVDIHGGSLRVWVGHMFKRMPRKSVEEIIDSEKSMFHSEPFTRFARTADARIRDAAEWFKTAKAQGKKVVGFGASAKGNILLNCVKKLDETLLPDYILDETPEKIGRFSPGTGLEIKSLERTALERFAGIDAVIILAWNFRDEMTAKLRALGFTGDIICPVRE